MENDSVNPVEGPDSVAVSASAPKSPPRAARPRNTPSNVCAQCRRQKQKVWMSTDLVDQGVAEDIDFYASVTARRHAVTAFEDTCHISVTSLSQADELHAQVSPTPVRAYLSFQPHPFEMRVFLSRALRGS